MKLPQFQSTDKDFALMQNQWASILEPLLSKPINAGRLIRNVALVTGANVVNHGLGRKLQGWFITRLRAASDIYDTQDSNSMPELTLQLTASAPATVDLYVF